MTAKEKVQQLIDATTELVKKEREAKEAEAAYLRAVLSGRGAATTIQNTLLAKFDEQYIYDLNSLLGVP